MFSSSIEWTSPAQNALLRQTATFGASPSSASLSSLRSNSNWIIVASLPGNMARKARMNISDTDRVKSSPIANFFSTPPSKKRPATSDDDELDVEAKSAEKKSKTETKPIEIPDSEDEDVIQTKARKSLKPRVIADSEDDESDQILDSPHDKASSISSGKLGKSSLTTVPVLSPIPHASTSITPLKQQFDLGINLDSPFNESVSKHLGTTENDAPSPTAAQQKSQSSGLFSEMSLDMMSTKDRDDTGKSEHLSMSAQSPYAGSSETDDPVLAGAKKNLQKAHDLGVADHYVTQSTGQRRRSKKATRNADPNNPFEQNIQIKCDECANVTIDPLPRFDERDGCYVRRQIICYKCKENGREKKYHPTHTPVDGRDTIREQNVPNRA
ncbi:hypothetical protein AMS68_005122 [Peltaster fructicola]|uniref:Uncharacterized protein n=1 Tax=Peltaster fructicola TaxID=286661 RepID=A0A6H0XY69_9PEZI|nr:hypothetical protein AMS68_005122 [Peltaster fructicola]